MRAEPRKVAIAPPQPEERVRFWEVLEGIHDDFGLSTILSVQRWLAGAQRTPLIDSRNSASITNRLAAAGLVPPSTQEFERRRQWLAWMQKWATDTERPPLPDM